MYCDNCGNQLRDGAKFCSKCGTAVKPITETAEQEFKPLTPKFDNVDTDKPIQGRIKAIDKPLFEDNTKVSESTSKKKKKKEFIISLSVLLTVIISIIVMTFINNYFHPPLTLEIAYDSYIDLLEKYRDDIEEYATENNVSNIALYDCNDTGIPDMFYVVKETKDGETVNQVHVVIDDGYQVYDSVASSINYDIDFIFFKEGDDKSIWYEQFDLKDMNNVRCKPEFYTRMDGFKRFGNWKLVKFEEEENIPVTVVLSCFKNYDINKHFSNIVGNISLSYDEAIAFLKKKQPLSVQQSESKKSNDNNDVSIIETIENTLPIVAEPLTEQSTEMETEEETIAETEPQTTSIEWTEFSYDTKDTDGYTYKITVKLSPWILYSETDILNSAWSVVGKDNLLPTFESWNLHKDSKNKYWRDYTGRSSDFDKGSWYYSMNDMYYCVGNVSIQNTTEGWNITKNATRTVKAQSAQNLLSQTGGSGKYPGFGDGFFYFFIINLVARNRYKC